MKWTKEKIEELEGLISQGLKPRLIADIMGVNYKTINNKMFRLKLKSKVIYHENVTCKHCGNVFEKYIKSEQDFCSSSCAATYNNTGRKLTEETKTKISNTLKSKKEKHKKNRVCKNCNINEITKKYKSVCDKCRYEYYEYYRPSCVFKFNPYDYPDEFNLELIKQYGWYSPLNKKNNLYGISKDHKYSVKEGYINGVSPDIISHPANCELLLFSNNSRKRDKSSITLEELYEKIKNWDSKYSPIV